MSDAPGNDDDGALLICISGRLAVRFPEGPKPPAPLEMT